MNAACVIIAVHDGNRYRLALEEKTVDSLLSKAVSRPRTFFLIKLPQQKDIFGFKGIPPLDGRNFNGLIKYKDNQVDPDSLQELLSTCTPDHEVMLHFISTVSMPLLPLPSVVAVNTSNRPEEQNRGSSTQIGPSMRGTYSAMFSYE